MVCQDALMSNCHCVKVETCMVVVLTPSSDYRIHSQETLHSNQVLAFQEPFSLHTLIIPLFHHEHS